MARIIYYPPIFYSAAVTIATAIDCLKKEMDKDKPLTYPFIG